ncbi:MAG: phosphodiester glycosidase family protein [Candidatus Beckwithbacteria bacterium]
MIRKKVLIISGLSVFAAGLILAGFFVFKQFQNVKNLTNQLAGVSQELNQLKFADQYLINQAQEATISAIQKTFTQTIAAYEALLNLKLTAKTAADLDKLFTQILTYLSETNYASASASLSQFNDQLQAAQTAAALQSVSIQPPAVQSNTPPGSGFSRQSVSADIGTYTVSLVAADLNSTRVIVDTASDSTCTNACPVLPLADYVARNNAFAGINGSYFCPESYPSCAGKTNAFDTLLMNKNKVYFNSDNNVYSTVPAVLFSGSSPRFVSQSLELGRDTSPDSVIANYPLLLKDGQVVFGGNDDPKQGSKGNRSFVANKGSTVYIGVVHNVTVAESARVLSALGLDNALNLDSGGSTALWSSGYKVGPGRNLPNVILFVSR